MQDDCQNSLLSAIFAHIRKGRKKPRKTPNLQTRQGASANAACRVAQLGVRRLQFPAAVSSAFPLEKLCKNAKKRPFLLSGVVISAQSAEIRDLQGFDSQRVFVLSAFLRKNDQNLRKEPFRRNLSARPKRPSKQNPIFAYTL